MSFEEAAAVPSAALTALQGLRDNGQIQAGQNVLINGASGGVGTFAVQIAKAFGAEVTGVCSTRNVDLVRMLGADHVIDYTQEDVTRNGQQYDLILDAAAYRPFSDYKRALAPQGTYVLVGGSGGQFLRVTLLGPRQSKKGGQTFRTFIVKPKQTDLLFVKDLLEAGHVKPAIDRRYPLQEAADALRHLETGHTQGKTVLKVENSGLI
jgi:NADPH:quinone reductase-like Zn-dependent oxidoreductase